MNNDALSHDRARALMMAALDNEISPDERRELDALIAASSQLAEEWRRLTRVKEVTVGMTLEQLPQEAWDGYWTSVYWRTERGVAWVLISIGAIILGSYWLWHAISALLAPNPDMPLLLRLAIFAVGIGAVILVVSVIREKFFVHRTDPYKEIIR